MDIMKAQACFVAFGAGSARCVVVCIALHSHGALDGSLAIQHDGDARACARLARDKGHVGVVYGDLARAAHVRDGEVVRGSTNWLAHLCHVAESVARRDLAPDNGSGRDDRGARTLAPRRPPVPGMASTVDVDQSHE